MSGCWHAFGAGRAWGLGLGLGAFFVDSADTCVADAWMVSVCGGKKVIWIHSCNITNTALESHHAEEKAGWDMVMSLDGSSHSAPSGNLVCVISVFVMSRSSMRLVTPCSTTKLTDVYSQQSTGESFP